MNESIVVKKDKQKLIYLEFMRVIAIFLVIFNHTGDNGFFLFSKYIEENWQFWVYLFMSIFCKVAVPIFLAISGAIMLEKEEEPLSVIWKKRIFRIFIVLLSFSLIYYIYTTLRYDLFLNIKIFFKIFFQNFFQKTVKFHLWYLYMYIAYLISLPFLRILVKNMKNKHFYYLIGLTMFFEVFIPILEYVLWKGNHKINANFEPAWLTTSILIYPCVGYFLHNKIKIKDIKKTILILWIINAITIVIVSVMTYSKWKMTGILSEGQSQEFHSIPNLINLICIFVTIKYIFENIKILNVLEKIILSVGSCTFGIYLIHIFINELSVTNFIFKSLLKLKINDMLISFIFCLFIMILSYIIIYLIKKIPFFKKLI